MKKINFKKVALLLLLVVSILLLFGIGYSLKGAFHNNSQAGLAQKHSIKNQNESIKHNVSLNNINPGANNTTGNSLDNSPIILNDGNYIMTTDTGIIKLSAFGTILYSYSFSDLEANSYTTSFADYQTRQVVQNYLDPTLFYLLIYSPSLAINFDDTTASISSPGYVLTLKDNDNGFSLLSMATLNLPSINNNITAQNLLKNLTFTSTLIGPDTTNTEIRSLNTASSSKSLKEKWAQPAAGKEAPGINYEKTVFENLYLNNLNNMVFNDNNLFIFGGNNLPNFWFYSFNIYDNVNILVNPKLYLNTNAGWSMTSSVMNFNPKIKDITLNNYPAYFIIGAKTLVQNNYVDNQPSGKPIYSVQVASAISGFVDVNKAGQTVSAFLNSTYVYQTSPTSLSVSGATYYILSSMDGNTANQFVGSSSPSNLFKSSAIGMHLKVLNLVGRQIDGYMNNLTDRLYGFDIQYIAPSNGSGLGAVNGLLVGRDSMVRIIYNPDNLLPVTARNDRGNLLVKEYTLPLNSSNTLEQSYTKQIFFYNNSWNLLINKDSNQSKIYSLNLQGTALPLAQSISGSGEQSRLVLGTDIIQISTNSQILGFLTLSNDFIYALIKNLTTNDVYISLFKYNSSSLGFQIYENYVYSPNLPFYYDNSPIWGTVKLRSPNYLQEAGYFSQSANEIASDNAKLQNLIVFTPAWEGQTALVSTTTQSVNSQDALPLIINLKYFNGKMYNNQSFQNSLNFPDSTLIGLNGLPSWVIPVSIISSVGFLAIVVILGLSIGIPFAQNRKLQNKGFHNTYKKIDSLTVSVGSVYKKIVQIQKKENNNNLPILKGTLIKSAPVNNIVKPKKSNFLPLPVKPKQIPVTLVNKPKKPPVFYKQNTLKPTNKSI